ncbi:MAG: aminoacyl-tRNA hydrolase [Acidobacteriota bacterium]|nr:aminoacyl-tRNA hydrolase [Acidobacteriota bacterium]
MADSDTESAALILGLGNPGERYRETRHNVGFKVLDVLSDLLDGGPRRIECNSLIAAAAAESGLYLAWPQTYMNRSGYAARCLAESLEVEEEKLLVVYDDVTLPNCRLRIRRAGGAGGHRGMESIIHNLRSEDVSRLRVGVGPEEPEARQSDDLSEYVLSPFSARDSETVKTMTARAAEACLCWWRVGVDTAMNRFNVA